VAPLNLKDHRHGVLLGKGAGAKSRIVSSQWQNCSGRPWAGLVVEGDFTYEGGMRSADILLSTENRSSTQSSYCSVSPRVAPPA
jgi:hypothetical protein